MIRLDMIYGLAGLMFAAFAVLSLARPREPKRWRNAVFWALLATSFLVGDRLGDLGNGLLVVALALTAGLGGLAPPKPDTPDGEPAQAVRSRLGLRLLIPNLAIPVVALGGTLAAKSRVFGQPLFGPDQPSVVALGVGVVIALVLAIVLLRPRPLAPLKEGLRLMDVVGWSGVLPQLLAALGAVFAAAGVGPVVGDLVTRTFPIAGPLSAVSIYCLGMAAFTVLMGNAYAAFPVMTAGVGLPLVVMRFGGDPAVVGAIGMLAGFCGTLVTPMAANFNLVPASLLELPDRNRAFNGVIRAQAPTAAILLVCNIALMYALAFHR